MRNHFAEFNGGSRILSKEKGMRQKTFESFVYLYTISKKFLGP